MSSSVSSRVLAVGLASGFAVAIGFGCSTDDGTTLPPAMGTAGTPPGSAGSVGMGGGNTAGTPATTGGSGAGTPATTAGTGGTPGASGSGGTPGASGSGGGGTAGAPPAGDITKVAPTPGCGKAPPANGKVTIMTMGTKDANCAAKTTNNEPRCGPWGQPASTWRKEPLPRDYYLYLPQGYDMNKAYPLVLLGPGCGGNGSSGDIYSYNNNANNTVIRVGVTPADRNIVGHGTNAGEGCFDDKEGDDSVDFVMYENMWDKLANEICFDKNRVFAGGNSSGAWWSNELGCKYAGDPTRPMRGIMPNTGGLPSEPQWKPTCTNKPMAGMWVHEINDGTNPFSGNKYAIARAMMVNGCTMGTNFDNATLDPFPGGPGVCKMIKGCPQLYPLVVCPLDGNGHGSHPEIVDPGVSTFLQMFQKAPFLTP